MSGILVVAEHRQGALSAASLETITAAKRLKEGKDQPIAVVLMAKDPDQYVDQVSVERVDEVIKVAVPVEDFQSDIYEAVLQALIRERKPSVVLVPHSVDAWGYAPVVAAREGYGCATDVFDLKYEGEELIATRAAYAEKVHMEVDFPGKETVVLTIRGNVFEPAEGQGQPQISSFEAPEAKARTEHTGYIQPDTAGDVDISQAEYMLSIGRGIGEEENVEQFQELADLIGFTLGCSRPVADNGWLPKSRQVGQSGKTVANCKVYLAMGISGSVQHMAGMKHVPNIIAVNTDAEASIFSIARYGVVADVFDIAGELRNHFQ
ncbi:MAG: electron transfer flavoprotein subunit alpha/FixB family protein [Gammaproteobacteria bacterium]